MAVRVQPRLATSFRVMVSSWLLIYTEDNITQPFTYLIFNFYDHFIGFSFVLCLCCDTDIYHACVCGKPDGWVAQDFEVGDLLVDHALAKTGAMQNADLDDLVQVETSLQVGDDGLVENIFHFVGDTGQGNDCVAFGLNDEAWRSADRVWDAQRAFWNIRLTFLIRGWLAPITRNNGNDLFPQVLAEFKLKPVARATALRVGSSTVGPSPPVVIMISARLMELRIDLAMRSALSPMVTVRYKSTPMPRNVRAI